MGEGGNVQKRLVALHHLDAPWRPADIEQCEGRILRQGNTNEFVKTFRGIPDYHPAPRSTLQHHDPRAHTYDANVSDNPLGTIASLEHAISSLDERVREREADLKQFHRQSEDLSKQLGQPFEYEENLSTATKRQQGIVAALDITKNQASANVGEGAEQTDLQAQTVQQTAPRTGRVHTPAV